jgi:hypothetical protein
MAFGLQRWQCRCRTEEDAVVVGLPIAAAPWGSNPFLGGGLAVANFGSHASYIGAGGRGPLPLKIGASPTGRVDLVPLTMSRARDQTPTFFPLISMDQD